MKPNLRDIPDQTIDWDNFKYNSASDCIRPEVGYRICNKCKRILPVNIFHFSRNKASPDGYNYTCKKCNREYYLKSKNKNNN